MEKKTEKKIKRTKQEIGRKAKRDGKLFEDRVAIDLEKKGWVVSRWMKNVEFVEASLQINFKTKKTKIGKLIPAKPSIRMTKTSRGFLPVLISTWTGFVDFIVFRHGDSCDCGHECGHIIGVECKVGKYLDKEEKAKCKWYLDNNIFSQILIASRGKKRGEIIYEEYEKS